MSAVSTASNTQVRIATIGSVDDGKSTMIGRLLFDSKQIFDDQLASLANDSLQRTRKLNLNLVAAFGGEDVNDAVKCLRCVVGVQCCENKVTSFGKRECDGD